MATQFLTNDYLGPAYSLQPQSSSRINGLHAAPSRDGGLSNDWTGPGWYLDTYSDSHEAFMSQGDFSGQQWLISMPMPAAGSGYSTHAVYTQAPPIPVYNDHGPSQVGSGGQHSGSKVGKIAGGLGAAYMAHKVWDKFT